MLAKELALEDSRHWLDTEQMDFAFELEEPLPLDNLDKNILCDDALFCKWPKVNAFIGNPPFQSKNKAQEELGAAYMNRVRKQYPEVPGHADYCVYWFRRAHNELAPGGNAGLVGTKTIRETNSRKGGLQYIVTTGGTITEAVSRQVWSGEAAVDVSIVNWTKGEKKGKKRLYLQHGDRRDSPWEVREMDRIHAGLSFEIDVGDAIDLTVNEKPKTFFQGITPGHDGFLLSADRAKILVGDEKKNQEVLFPYLIGDDILGQLRPRPKRYVIDFQPRDLIQASTYPHLFKIVQTQVLEKRKAAVGKEEKRNVEVEEDDPEGRTNKHHKNFLKKWWQISYPRTDLFEALSKLSRFIVCVRTTKRPIFEFIHPAIKPGDSLQVFAFEDDYSFGILQSPIHWKWFTERCSKLSARFRYTSETVYSTFPWPQSPALKLVQRVSRAAVELRQVRQKAMDNNKITFRAMYKTMELPGDNVLKDAHAALDEAVRECYGMKAKDDPLKFLLDLNEGMAAKEQRGEDVVGPGLPSVVTDRKPFITNDCITV